MSTPSRHTLRVNSSVLPCHGRVFLTRKPGLRRLAAPGAGLTASWRAFNRYIYGSLRSTRHSDTFNPARSWLLQGSQCEGNGHPTGVRYGSRYKLQNPLCGWKLKTKLFKGVSASHARRGAQRGVLSSQVLTHTALRHVRPLSRPRLTAARAAQRLGLPTPLGPRGRKLSQRGFPSVAASARAFIRNPSREASRVRASAPKFLTGEFDLGAWAMGGPVETGGELLPFPPGDEILQYETLVQNIGRSLRTGLMFFLMT